MSTHTPQNLKHTHGHTHHSEYIRFRNQQRQTHSSDPYGNTPLRTQHKQTPFRATHTHPSHLTQTDILLRMTQTRPTDPTRAHTCLRTKKDSTPQNRNGTLSSTEHGSKNMRSNMCNTPSDTTQTHTHQPNTEAHSSDSTWRPTHLRTNTDKYSLYQKRAHTAQNTTRKHSPQCQHGHRLLGPTVNTHPSDPPWTHTHIQNQCRQTIKTQHRNKPFTTQTQPTDPSHTHTHRSDTNMYKHTSKPTRGGRRVRWIRSSTYITMYKTDSHYFTVEVAV